MQNVHLISLHYLQRSFIALTKRELLCITHQQVIVPKK